MFDNLKSTMKDPEFQRAAALAAGRIGATIASIAISTLVQKGVETGINKLMDKIQVTTTEVTPTE